MSELTEKLRTETWLSISRPILARVSTTSATSSLLATLSSTMCRNAPLLCCAIAVAVAIPKLLDQSRRQTTKRPSRERERESISHTTHKTTKSERERERARFGSFLKCVAITLLSTKVLQPSCGESCMEYSRLCWTTLVNWEWYSP